jgi:hypothetical protein
MNYAQEILILRDKMHKDIIHTVQRANTTGDDFDIELEHPFSIWITEDYHDDEYQVKIAITGVSGNTGELLTQGITENAYCDVKYNDLTMEQLAFLHREIETKQFTINII